MAFMLEQMVEQTLENRPARNGPEQRSTALNGA